MAKRPAQQLDLFGFATGTASPEAEHNPVVEPVLPSPHEGEIPGVPENGIIFSNELISIRIKKKVPEQPVDSAVVLPVAAEAVVEVETTQANHNASTSPVVAPTVEPSSSALTVDAPADEGPTLVTQDIALAVQPADEAIPAVSIPQPVADTLPKPLPAAKPQKLKASVKVIMPAAAEAKPKSKRGRKSFKEMDDEVDLVAVPDDEVLEQKLYYSISEVAGWFNVNTSLIRAWENEFDILKPRKNRKGDRLFRVEDIRNLQLIYYLLRVRKFSVDGARNYLKQSRQKADLHFQLIRSLTKFRTFLLELKANLAG
jgi:DNA-binding transcriptional MerR regulator